MALENQNRRERLAKDVESAFGKVWSGITSLGEHSTLGADEAAIQIRIKTKAPPKEASHGDSHHEAPAAHHEAPKAAPKAAGHDDHGAAAHH